LHRGCADYAYSLGGDASKGWKTPHVLVLLIVGVLLIAVFIVWEIKYPHSMIDMNIWKDRDFSLVGTEICRPALLTEDCSYSSFCAWAL
jgi:hypothetical protein